MTARVLSRSLIVQRASAASSPADGFSSAFWPRLPMQLQLAFLERPVEPGDGSNGPWDQIDPQAQIAALVLLSRLIAQKLVSKVVRESGDE